MGSLNYRVSGDGAPVILIHGLAASLCDWERVAPAISRMGYRTYAVDLPGHGNSPQPEHSSDYTAEAFYEQLVDWIDSLHLLTPPVLVGHSLGGYLCLRLARCKPEQTGGLVLVNPFYSPFQMHSLARVFLKRPHMLETGLRLAPEWLFHLAANADITNSARFPPQARKQIAIDFKRASPMLVHLPGSIHDLTPELSGIQTPALVIWGDRDLTLNPKSFSQMVSRLPNVTARTVCGCGHQPHIGRADLTIEYILGYLQSVDGSHPAG